MNEQIQVHMEVPGSLALFALSVIVSILFMCLMYVASYSRYIKTVQNFSGYEVANTVNLLAGYLGLVHLHVPLSPPPFRPPLSPH